MQDINIAERFDENVGHVTWNFVILAHFLHTFCDPLAPLRKMAAVNVCYPAETFVTRITVIYLEKINCITVWSFKATFLSNGKIAGTHRRTRLGRPGQLFP